MAESKKQLHIAIFPWLAFGHITPFFKLAKLIAHRKGHRISFISTPRNIDRLPNIPPNLAPLITLVKLPLSHVDNLPENAESTMDTPQHLMPYLMKGHDSLEEPLSRFMETSCPNWIIHDFSPYWLPPIAARLGIKLAFFLVSNASSLCFAGPPKLLLSATSETTDEPNPNTRTELDHFIVPPKWVPFPTKIAYRRYEAKKVIASNARLNDSGVSDYLFRLSTMYSSTDVLATKTCMEIEAKWLNLLGKLVHIPAVPLGLLPPSPNEGNDDKDSTWDTISQWLDKKEKGSVVYVALGSEIQLSQEEFNELAMGLEQSRLPFFWAKRKHLSVHGDSMLFELPDGFEERTKGRGIVWTGWVPQSKILGHESIGGFLTHCGWGSVTEAFEFGRVLIMLPFNGDQGLNARLLEEEQVGVEIPRNEEDGSFTRDSVAQTLRLAMKDAEGHIIREKAKEMAPLLANTEHQHQYVDKFVELLENHRQITKG